nr:retrovirus-related Pol polyprotein from transposon TNT 1-94 [Tanacetum cinerariifolium]
MAWLNYDEHVDSPSTMENEVGVTSPESTIQTIPSFKENTSPVTYPDEVEETIGLLIEVEPLDETPLEDLCLNTCNHDIPLSFREIPSFDEPEPQPQPLPSFLSLDLPNHQWSRTKVLLLKHTNKSLDDNEMVEVKVLMALVDDENVAISKEGAQNDEWVQISMKKYDIRMPICYLDSGCSRHMTGVKSYMHKYVEQLGPKVVFRDDCTCTTGSYGCIKEVVMIAPRVRDVYVLDMTSSAQQSCFFTKASESLNWIWHKKLAHLNCKTINQLAKQNLVIGLPSLVYSKDKPCSSCEKQKHYRASFKTKLTSLIKKCLHLLRMDLFGPVTPRSINHEKYTLVIVDECS